MNNFWGGVVLLIAVTVVLLAVGDREKPQSSINFTDLETECRAAGETANYRLAADNSIEFSGRFNEINTLAQLDYEYSKTDDRITLNVQSEADPITEGYEGNCLASVVYKAETPPIEEGRYVIDIQHNGETAKKQIIRVN